MVKKRVIIEDFEEVLERKTKPIGNAAYIGLSKKHRGKKVIAIICGKIKK